MVRGFSPSACSPGSGCPCPEGFSSRPVVRPNEPYVEDFVAWITSEFEPNRLYGMPRGMRQAPAFVNIGKKR